jgi:hypothetical protein
MKHLFALRKTAGDSFTPWVGSVTGGNAMTGFPVRDKARDNFVRTHLDMRTIMS